MGCDLAVGHERGMRNPLEWKARCCGGRSGVHGVEAARRGGTSPAGGVRAVPALGSAGKGVCAYAQDVTRPKIRPAGPNAQRRGARRGVTALGRWRAGSGPKGCTAAYTIVPKRTSGRRRSSLSFGLKRRPAQSARRRRPAAEMGRSSWRSRCGGVSGLLGPAGGFQVDLRLSHGVREVGVALALKNSMAELLTGGGMLCLSFEGSGG